MSENTKIEWADHTFNPWIGCQKVSPACEHCYAEAWDRRFAVSGHAMRWGEKAQRTRTSVANWRLPLKWNKQAQADGRRFRVFCASLADVFDNQVPADWRLDLFELIRATPHLDWLLLTKRIGNAGQMITDTVSQMDIGYAPPFAAWPWPNVWLGATICNQAEADRDIPKLLATEAQVRFLSIEPMLGPVDLSSIPVGGGHGHHEFDPIIVGNVLQRASSSDPSVHWVICGGESGPQARPMHPDWARSLRDQCAAAGVPFLFKQWGEWREPAAGEEFDTSMGRAQRVPAFIVAPSGTVQCFHNDQTRDGGKAMIRVGKKAAGRMLDGIEHNGFPGA